LGHWFDEAGRPNGKQTSTLPRPAAADERRLILLVERDDSDDAEQLPEVETSGAWSL
jgi:hypothetical protein